MTIEDIMMTCQVTDILTYGMKKTRLKTLQMSPTPGTEELVKKASDVIPILEIWNWCHFSCCMKLWQLMRWNRESCDFKCISWFTPKNSELKPTIKITPGWAYNWTRSPLLCFVRRNCQRCGKLKYTQQFSSEMVLKWHLCLNAFLATQF